MSFGYWFWWVLLCLGLFACLLDCFACRVVGGTMFVALVCGCVFCYGVGFVVLSHWLFDCWYRLIFCRDCSFGFD